MFIGMTIQQYMDSKPTSNFDIPLMSMLAREESQRDAPPLDLDIPEPMLNDSDDVMEPTQETPMESVWNSESTEKTIQLQHLADEADKTIEIDTSRINSAEESAPENQAEQILSPAQEVEHESPEKNGDVPFHLSQTLKIKHTSGELIDFLEADEIVDPQETHDGSSATDLHSQESPEKELDLPASWAAILDGTLDEDGSYADEIREFLNTLPEETESNSAALEVDMAASDIPPSLISDGIKVNGGSNGRPPTNMRLVEIPMISGIDRAESTRRFLIVPLEDQLPPNNLDAE